MARERGHPPGHQKKGNTYNKDYIRGHVDGQRSVRGGSPPPPGRGGSGGTRGGCALLLGALLTLLILVALI